MLENAMHTIIIDTHGNMQLNNHNNNNNNLHSTHL